MRLEKKNQLKSFSKEKPIKRHKITHVILKIHKKTYRKQIKKQIEPNN